MGNIHGIYTMLQMTIIVLNDMNIIIHKKVDISVNYHNLCYFHRTAFYRFDMILSFSGGKQTVNNLGLSVEHTRYQ